MPRHRPVCRDLGAGRLEALYLAEEAGGGLIPPNGYRRTSYLAPDITQAILEGSQPRDLTAEKLLAHSRLPLAWHDQRTALGFA
jgi:hypothetical protein